MIYEVNSPNRESSSLCLPIILKTKVTKRLRFKELKKTDKIKDQLKLNNSKGNKVPSDRIKN